MVLISKEENFVLGLNGLEVKNLLGYSYGTVRRTLYLFKRYGLVRFTKGVSKRGKFELEFVLNEPNVKFSQISEKIINSVVELEVKNSDDGKKEFDKWFRDEIKKLEIVKDAITKKKSEHKKKSHK